MKRKKKAAMPQNEKGAKLIDSSPPARHTRSSSKPNPLTPRSTVPEPPHTQPHTQPSTQEQDQKTSMTLATLTQPPSTLEQDQETPTIILADRLCFVEVQKKPLNATDNENDASTATSSSWWPAVFYESLQEFQSCHELDPNAKVALSIQLMKQHSERLERSKSGQGGGQGGRTTSFVARLLGRPLSDFQIQGPSDKYQDYHLFLPEILGVSSTPTAFVSETEYLNFHKGLDEAASILIDHMTKNEEGDDNGDSNMTTPTLPAIDGFYQLAKKALLKENEPQEHQDQHPQEHQHHVHAHASHNSVGDRSVAAVSISNESLISTNKLHHTLADTDNDADASTVDHETTTQGSPPASPMRILPQASWEAVWTELLLKGWTCRKMPGDVTGVGGIAASTVLYRRQLQGPTMSLEALQSYMSQHYAWTGPNTTIATTTTKRSPTKKRSPVARKNQPPTPPLRASRRVPAASSSSSSAASAPFYKWGALWDTLKKKGWAYTQSPGGSIAAWIYCQPGISATTPNATLGQDLFHSVDQVVDYCRAHNYYEQYGNPSTTTNQESNSSSEEEEESEEEEGAPSKSGSEERNSSSEEEESEEEEVLAPSESGSEEEEEAEEQVQEEEIASEDNDDDTATKTTKKRLPAARRNLPPTPPQRASRRIVPTPTASSSSNAASTQFYKNGTLWPWLQTTHGWHYEKARGGSLYDWIYYRPEFSAVSANATLGEDLFHSVDQIVDYCREHNYYESYCSSTTTTNQGLSFKPRKEHTTPRARISQSKADVKVTAAEADDDEEGTNDEPAVEEAEEDEEEDAADDIEAEKNAHMDCFDYDIAAAQAQEGGDIDLDNYEGDGEAHPARMVQLPAPNIPLAQNESLKNSSSSDDKREEDLEEEVNDSTSKAYSDYVASCRPSTREYFTDWDKTKNVQAHALAAEMGTMDPDMEQVLNRFKPSNITYRNDHDPNQLPVQASSSSIFDLLKGRKMNDETIHYFFRLLSIQEENKNCIFLHSFLPTERATVGQASTRINGEYDYSRVETLSGGQDIFEHHKVFFPINVDSMHWVCVVAFIQEKRLLLFNSADSMGGAAAAKTYLIWTLRFLKDEHLKKKGSRLKGKWNFYMEDEQSLRESRPEDGGVFVCLFAVFLQMDYPLVYKQKHILGFRRRIAMCIIHNKFTKAADTK
jgi:hypothetical protein